jgi:transporter family-2 protein
MQKITALIFLTALLVAAVLLDHFGVFGLPRHTVSLTRIAAIALILGGIAVIFF